MLHEQVEEVSRFVADNARRVLGVDAAKVLPVSARVALDAKLAASVGSNGAGLALAGATCPACIPTACTPRGCTVAVAGMPHGGKEIGPHITVSSCLLRCTGSG